MFQNITKDDVILKFKDAIDNLYGSDCAYYDVDGFAIANAIYDVIEKMSFAPTIHVLKIYPQYFDEIRLGFKKFEVRYNDRDYKNGDYLLLREYDVDTNSYTMRTIFCKVTSILGSESYFVKDGYVIMSIEVVE